MSDLEHDKRSVIELIHRIATLEAALRPFVRHYEKWMDANGYPDHIEVSTFPRHTYGELRAARAALDKDVGK